MHGRDSERVVEQNVVVPVLQIRKEIGEVTKLIPEGRISECIVEEITDVLVPRRRTRDSSSMEGSWNSQRRTGPIWVMKMKRTSLKS